MNISCLCKLILAAAFCVVIGLVAFCPQMHPGGDAASYICLARSIAQGGYNRIWEPGAPAEKLIPVGYPLLLVPFGRSVAGAKATSFFFYILALIFGIRFFYRSKLLDDMKPFAMLVYGLFPIFILCSSYELADVPFFSLVMGALAFWGSWPMFILAGLSAVIKPVGALVVIAWAVERRSKAAIGAGVVFLALFLFLGRGRGAAALVNPYDIDSGKAGVVQFMERIPKNIVKYSVMLVEQGVPK